MKKRLLSMLLVFVMLLSILPVGALAADAKQVTIYLQNLPSGTQSVIVSVEGETGQSYEVQRYAGSDYVTINVENPKNKSVSVTVGDQTKEATIEEHGRYIYYYDATVDFKKSSSGGKWDNDWYETCTDKSTVKFVIENGTWNEDAFALDEDAVVEGDTVTFTTYKWPDGNFYVYKCSFEGGTMEQMLNVVLNGTTEESTYIIPNAGYSLTGIDATDWEVEEGGGLTNFSGTANQQMSHIKDNIHYLDTHENDATDGFKAGTVYVLRLIKTLYTVSYEFKSGTPDVALPTTGMPPAPSGTTTATYKEEYEVDATTYADVPDGTDYKWTFKGWFTDADMTIPAGETITITADVKLYGKWVREEVPHNITGVSKTVVTSSSALPADVEAALNGKTITYPTAAGITIPEDELVTLLYKITVTGDPGASYVITDEDATFVIDGSDSGTLTTSSVDVYVTKTFGKDNVITIDDATYVSNTVIVNDGEDDEAEATENTEAKIIYLPDLSVEKTVTSVGEEQVADQNNIPTAKVGDTITWTITVRNIGLGAAEIPLPTDILTSSGESRTATVTADSKVETKTGPGGEVVYIVPASGDTVGKATFYATYEVTEADYGKTLKNTATVGGKTDTAPDVEVKEKELESDPSVKVTKTPKSTLVLLGGTMEWTVTVKNTGNMPLTGLKLTDSLPGAEITFVKKDSAVVAARSVSNEPTPDSFDLDEGETITFNVTYGPAIVPVKNVAIVYDGDEELGRGESETVFVLIPGGDDEPELNKDDHTAYIIGYPDGTVRPENNITRAEVATIFFRLMTEDSRALYWTKDNDFTDVSANAWYNNAVSTLSRAGIITGYPDGTFRPDAPITRAEFAAVVARFYKDAATGECKFTDVPATHWAAGYIALAQEKNLINGYPDGTFAPQKNITRAETMTLINRVLERAVKEEDMLEDMVTWSDNLPSAWYYEAVQEATNSHKYDRTDEKVVENSIQQNYFFEEWKTIEPVPDWAALEKSWAKVTDQ